MTSSPCTGNADQTIGPAVLSGVLAQPQHNRAGRHHRHSYDPFDGMRLNLAITEPGICSIAADRAAVDSGLCTPAILAAIEKPSQSSTAWVRAGLLVKADRQVGLLET